MFARDSHDGCIHIAKRIGLLLEISAVLDNRITGSQSILRSSTICSLPDVVAYTERKILLCQPKLFSFWNVDSLLGSDRSYLSRKGATNTRKKHLVQVKNATRKLESEKRLDPSLNTSWLKSFSDLIKPVFRPHTSGFSTWSKSFSIKWQIDLNQV